MVEKNLKEKNYNMSKYRKKGILKIYYLACIFGIIAVLIIIFSIKNIFLKKKLKEIQTAAYVDDPQKLDLNNRDSVSIGVNDKKGGLWDKKRIKNVHLVLELSIGGEEGDSNKVFYRPGPIVSDSNGSIYVGEGFDGRIKKFNQSGEYINTIGRSGQGPGELSRIFTFLINHNIINVLDFGNQRLSRFTCDGKFLDSVVLPHRRVGNYLAIDGEGNIYVSYYDIETEKVIHKFNKNGKYLCSFGKPVEFRAPLRRIDVTIKSLISGGPIFIYNKQLFFSQKNPYEIRIYKLNGILKNRIFRKNTFMPRMKFEITNKGGYRLTMPVQSTMIGVWDNMIINWVTIPPGNLGKHLNDTGSIIDLFDLNGQLLTSIKIPDRVWAYSIDQKGKIYGSTYSDIAKVVRYSLEYH